MDIKEDANPVFSSDLYSDLFDGGYIKPEEFLSEDDSKKVNEAIKTIESFLSSLEDSGKLEVG